VDNVKLKLKVPSRPPPNITKQPDKKISVGMLNVGSYAGTSIIEEPTSPTKKKPYMSTSEKLRIQSSMQAQLKLEKDLEEVNLKNEEYAKIL